MSDNDNGNDFAAALMEAMSAVDALDAALRDVSEIVREVDNGVAAFTNGRLRATLHEGTRGADGIVFTWVAGIQTAFGQRDPEDQPLKPQLLLLLPDREAGVPPKLTREVCRMDFAATGYPVKLDGPRGTVFGEDREGLASAVREALSHPLTGRKIRGLLRDVDTDENDSTDQKVDAEDGSDE